MRSHSSRSPVIFAFIINLFLPLPIWLFATGFFPYKPFLPGQNHEPGAGGLKCPVAPFDKVVFMVVDALRSDFVFSKDSAFNFLHEYAPTTTHFKARDPSSNRLVELGAAIPFTAHATPPTITMPRIKAMTTGSIPSFLDAILNFAESDTSSSLSTQDSWPLQMLSMQNGRLLMFGDDTWLKLFPGFFSRSDGTSSFFVSDFTEVDRNVTRHVPHELAQDDWSGMVLHFLGLDHIGHKTGPRSVHMQPKQEEMDGIVKSIYTALETREHLRSTLLVLCGDHGMNDAGNHGGSTAGEVSPALVFISPKLQKSFEGMKCPSEPFAPYRFFEHVQQADVVPTLASLLGFPIPLNNLGVLIPKFLTMWHDPADRLVLLDRNIAQIGRSLSASLGNGIQEETSSESCAEEISNAHLWGCQLGRIRTVDQDGRADIQSKVDVRLDFLRKMQTALGNAATEYSISRLCLGIAGALTLTLMAFAAAKSLQSPARSTFIWAWIVLFGQSISVFSSSYVEEEHQVWYWLLSGWVIWLYIAVSRQNGGLRHISCLVMLGLGRIERRWNQTGQKHAGDADIGNTFLPNNTHILMALVVVTYVGIFIGLRWRTFPFASKGTNLFASLALVSTGMMFKISFTVADSPELLPMIGLVPREALKGLSLVTPARVVFGGIAAFLGLAFVRVIFIERISVHHPGNLSSSHAIEIQRHSLTDFARFLLACLSLLLVTQSRLQNIPLYLVLYTNLWLLLHLDLGTDETTISLILLQHASFFSFGGSNAMSSIDLSSAYNGVVDFNVVAVGLLLFLGNWAGSIWWTIGIISQSSRMRGGSWRAFLRQTTLFNLFSTSSVVAVMLACMVFRSHLFVWTVFSPKYLYGIAWSLGQHLLVTLGLGSLAFWAGLQVTGGSDDGGA